MVRLDYALLPHRGDWRAARIHEAADEFLVPLERVRGGGVAGAQRPPSGRALRVEGAEVSAVQREHGALTVRVYNASPESSVVSIEQGDAPRRGWQIDLLGRPVTPFDGEITLRAWEIATLRLD
jgi:alpha-mannosidase